MSADKKTIINKLVHSSIFNNLYRLRLRSNYEDADSFILSLKSPETAGEFNKSVRDICWHILMILELLISRYIGKKDFKTIATEFIKNEKGNLSKLLIKKRLSIIDGLY